MRKIIALLILVALIATMSVSALAERPSEPFDHKKLEGEKYYKYDKFEKTFTYGENYVHEQGNVKINLLMVFTNEASGYELATMYVNIMNGSNKYTVKSTDIWIDDVIYSFKSMIELEGNASCVFLGKSSLELMEALLNAKEVSVRITTDSSTETFDLDTKQFDNSLRKFCKNAYELGFIDYFDYESNEEIAEIEESCPITITR